MLKNINNPFIIAEIGVNHNGSLDLALELLEAASKTGADAVKFQTWLPGEITGKYSINTDYIERKTTKNLSRYEISLSNCLTFDEFRVISKARSDLNIMFLSTADGPSSLHFLVDELDMKIIKVGSTELNNLDYLRLIGTKKRPVILSTGLGTLGEVERAINALQETGGSDLPLVVLHCTSEYPAPDKELNLKAINTLRSAFNVEVGFSDHSLGSEASIAAVALGSTVIEKHFTISHELEGSDQDTSMLPDAFRDFVSSIRKTVLMLETVSKNLSHPKLKIFYQYDEALLVQRFYRLGPSLQRMILF